MLSRHEVADDECLWRAKRWNPVREYKQSQGFWAQVQMYGHPDWVRVFN